MKLIQRIKLIGLTSALLMAFGLSQTAHAAYWVDGEDRIVKNNFGECWVDRWGGEEPTPECGGEPEAEPVDTDGDGVTDDKDRCPGTPAGVPVDKVGCPLDSDGDGVTDDKDRCPGTMMGARVDEHGCEVGAKTKTVVRVPPRLDAETPMVLQGVNFEFNSAVLTSNAKGILDGVAESLNAHTDQDVIISGHTDSRGADAYNQDLSERRAKSVVNYLASKGVSSGRLSAVGHGESMPIETNDTSAGRAANRRVELQTK
jgi:OOP family OmpA-OmpF porin